MSNLGYWKGGTGEGGNGERRERGKENRETEKNYNQMTADYD